MLDTDGKLDLTAWTEGVFDPPALIRPACTKTDRVYLDVASRLEEEKSSALFDQSSRAAMSDDDAMVPATHNTIPMQQNEFYRQFVALLLKQPSLLQEYLSLLQSLDVVSSTESIQLELATAGRSTYIDVNISILLVLTYFS